MPRQVIRELVLECIKAASVYVKKNETEFIKQVREASAVNQDATAKAHKKRIAKEQKRIMELNTLIRKIYEDNASGKLTDKRFEILSAEYENEQSELEQSIQKLQSEQYLKDVLQARFDPKKLPPVKKWKAEQAELLSQKAVLNNDYKKLKAETREVEIIRREVEQIVHSDRPKQKSHDMEL